MAFVALYLIIYSPNCKPDSKLQPEFSNSFSLSTASQKLILGDMNLITVCVTDRIKSGRDRKFKSCNLDIRIFSSICLITVRQRQIV